MALRLPSVVSSLHSIPGTVGWGLGDPCGSAEPWACLGLQPNPLVCLEVAALSICLSVYPCLSECKYNIQLGWVRVK